MNIGCKDLGVDCPYIAEGKTAAEAEGKLMYHAMQEHMDKMQGMSEDDAVGMVREMHDRLGVHEAH